MQHLPQNLYYPGRATPPIPNKEERLPFTVRVVSDDATLNSAISIRQAAYGRHVPELAKLLGEPEAHDRDPDVVVLLAESKLDRVALGTMRIQSNQSHGLSLEQSVTLPTGYAVTAWPRQLVLAWRAARRAAWQKR